MKVLVRCLVLAEVVVMSRRNGLSEVVLQLIVQVQSFCRGAEVQQRWCRCRCRCRWWGRGAKMLSMCTVCAEVVVQRCLYRGDFACD